MPFDDLWIANADGSGRHVLVSGSGELVFPRWSPDGTRIAYLDTGGVYVVDVSTGGTTRVTDTSPGPYGWPEWVDDDTLHVPVS